MKNSRTFIPVVIAFMIFLLAQYYIVGHVWKQKDEVFRLRYRTVASEVVNDMMTSGETGFNQSYYYIDYVTAPNFADNIKLFELDSSGFASKITENITKDLTAYEVLSKQLVTRFEKLGLEKKFDHKIYVNDLYLLDFNKKYHIYKASDEELNKQSTSGKILVQTFHSEGNNYFVTFDYYIDFANKEKIILREIAITLLLSILSLIILAVIFAATLRNYLREKRLSNLKTDFINNMTHELKTPLSTITVAGKTLKLEDILKDREKIIETANLIGKQSVHLNKLINLILEISMWERMQFGIEKSEVDMEELLRDIADAFRNGCGKECIFEEVYNLKGAKANVDVVYFTTMVSNLLHNAVKYSDGTPEIKLEATNGEGFTIAVSDKGIGINRADQKHIFEKFYRVTSGNIHSNKGLGLGLYYVKKIAEAHGGDVIVSSKPGKGSVFIISIP